MHCPGCVSYCARLLRSLIANETCTCVAVLALSGHMLEASRELCRGNFLIIVSGGKRLDFAAFTLILVLSVLLCWGMKETKTVNNSAFPPSWGRAS